jgi:hypothetical protein
MRPFRFLAEAGSIADGKALAADARRAEAFRMLRERLGISSIMIGGIDELAPVVERLKGT